MSLSQLALAWALSQPAVASVVLGARNVAHLDSALAVVSKTPSAEVVAEIDRIAPGPVKPIPRFERCSTQALPVGTFPGLVGR